MDAEATTPEELFEGFPRTVAVCRAVAEAVGRMGDATTMVTRSQVAFRRRRGFAWVWRPGQYVRSEVPAVLSIALPREAGSHRFKEVVQPSSRVWMHHLELHDPGQVDEEVVGWLAEGWAAAG